MILLLTRCYATNDVAEGVLDIGLRRRLSGDATGGCDTSSCDPTFDDAGLRRRTPLVGRGAFVAVLQAFTPTGRTNQVPTDGIYENPAFAGGFAGAGVGVTETCCFTGITAAAASKGPVRNTAWSLRGDAMGCDDERLGAWMSTPPKDVPPRKLPTDGRKRGFPACVSGSDAGSLTDEVTCASSWAA